MDEDKDKLFEDIIDEDTAEDTKATVEKDLFDDISDEEEFLAENNKNNECKDYEAVPAKPDLFDDDDEERDGVENDMSAIPVRSTSDHDRVPFNTPAVGCALDDSKTTALLTAAKESAQQKLDVDSRKTMNGDARKASSMEITLTGFSRIGEGYNSYIVYTVQTLENGTTFTVQRRFSDFVVLHQLLMENYLPRGVIVPPSPEKNFMGTAKVKLGSNNTSSEDQSLFIKRRKAALERYLRRLAQHHLISKDETLKRFLREEDAPKPNPNASGFKGFMKNVESMVSRATSKINEVDEWYDEKQQHVLELEETLKKLLVVADNTVTNRRDVALRNKQFASSIRYLADGEDNTSLQSAINKLADLQDNLDLTHQAQADHDLFIFSETVKDYIALIQSAKAAFNERVSTFSTWESAQSTLAKKREAKNRAQAQGKADKVSQCEADIQFWEDKVNRCQEDFELISKNLKDEIKIFEAVWVSEIKSMIITYFQNIIDTQKQVVNHWKEFLPEAKTIN